MSGGIAYVLDDEGDFSKRCNLEMVELERLSDADKETLRNLLSNHQRYTQSPVAKGILDDFDRRIKKFVKVMPLEYKRILQSEEKAESTNLDEVSDG
jgi:glutamate synthase domain-containing protein 3